MSEIEPKIVDGEPVCDWNCPSMEETRKYRMCLIDETMDVDDETPCIPALRQQRDQAIAERNSARAQLLEASETERYLKKQIAQLKAERDALIKEFGDALQHAWNDFCIDTGCFPDNFTLDRDILMADFSSGNFIRLAANMFSNEIRPKVAEMIERTEYFKTAWERCENENDELKDEIEQLKSERDELRREICIWAEKEKCETRTVEELSIFFWGENCFEEQGDE